MTKIRESDYGRFARLAYAAVQASLPKYSHPKSPHFYTLHQLAACVLLGIYLGKSYRDTVQFLLTSDEVRRVLELGDEIPDYSTLSRTFNKISTDDWEKMNRVLLLAANDGTGVEEEQVAVDSTYFAPTQASSTFLTKAGRKHTHYYAGALAVGIKSRYILGICSGMGPGSDVPYLDPLREKALRFGVLDPDGQRSQTILADRGFDGRTARAEDIINVTRRGGAIRSAELIARAELYAQARMDGLTGQRWIVETVNSVIKRKFGEHVRSRSDALRLREIFAKALVYNLHVLFAFFQTCFLHRKTALLTT